MTDDAVGAVLILLKEVRCTRKGNLVDILVNLLGSKTDTIVAYGNCICTKGNYYLGSAKFTLELALLVEGLQFLCRINGI